MPHITKSQVASRHRLGNRWVVSTYLPAFNTWYESTPLPYYMACLAIRIARSTWDTRTQSYKEPAL